MLLDVEYFDSYKLNVSHICTLMGRNFYYIVIRKKERKKKINRRFQTYVVQNIEHI